MSGLEELYNVLTPDRFLNGIAWEQRVGFVTRYLTKYSPQGVDGIQAVWLFIQLDKLVFSRSCRLCQTQTDGGFSQLRVERDILSSDKDMRMVWVPRNLSESSKAPEAN